MNRWKKINLIPNLPQIIFFHSDKLTERKQIYNADVTIFSPFRSPSLRFE